MKQVLTSLPAALSRAFRGGWRNDLGCVLEGALIAFNCVCGRLIPNPRLVLALAAGVLVCLVLTDRFLLVRDGGRSPSGWGWSFVVVVGALVPLCASAGFSLGTWLWVGLLLLLTFGVCLCLDLQS